MHGADRRAYFFCAMVLVQSVDDPVPLLATGRWYGYILLAEQGQGGFGYDPLFWLAEHRVTVAELPKGQKQKDT